MAARLVFLDSERGLPVLRRGWRTPDPSPTRNAGDLPRCGPKMFDIEMVVDGDDGHGLTPRSRGHGRPDRPGRPSAAHGASRTPSPPPAQADVRWTVPGVSPIASSPSTREPSPSGASWSSPESGAVHSGPDEAQAYMSYEPAFDLSALDAGNPGSPIAAGADQSQTMWMLCATMMPMTPAPGYWGGSELTCQPCDTAFGDYIANGQEEVGAQDESLPKGCTTVVDAPLCMPSLGSIGHPHMCADFCKYAKKAKGCKDGALCNRCHICTKKKAEPAPVSNRRRPRRG